MYCPGNSREHRERSNSSSHSEKSPRCAFMSLVMPNRPGVTLKWFMIHSRAAATVFPVIFEPSLPIIFSISRLTFRLHSRLYRPIRAPSSGRSGEKQSSHSSLALRCASDIRFPANSVEISRSPSLRRSSG